MMDQPIGNLSNQQLSKEMVYLASEGAMIHLTSWATICTLLQEAAARLRTIEDAGPWRYHHATGDARSFFESDDFTHDVRLYLSGDFGDDQRRQQYAAGILATLNGDKAPSANATDYSLLDGWAIESNKDVNEKTVWRVSRTASPFSTVSGKRVWVGHDLQEVIQHATAELAL